MLTKTIEVEQNNMNTFFEICHTLTVQYRYATYRCSLLPSAFVRGGFNQRFVGVIDV